MLAIGTIAALMLAGGQPQTPSWIEQYGVTDMAVSTGQIDRLRVLGDIGWQDEAEIWVWLPAGYDEATRYPVLYMHDGQNLFDPALTNYQKEWGMDEAVSRMAARGDLREWIIVGIRSPKQRYLTLFPEKLIDHLSEERVAALTSVANWEEVDRAALKGDDYLAWLTGVLKPRIDGFYSTLPGPEDTAVMGASMGGLMSLYALAEYPDIFGQAAALSTHYPLGAPDMADVSANVVDTTAAWARYLETSAMRPGVNRLYMDYGTATLDQYYPPYADAFDEMMAGRGWLGPYYESRRFTGAEHDEDAWRQRVDIPLGFLDRADP